MQATEGTQTEGMGACYCGKPSVKLYALTSLFEHEWYEDKTAPTGAVRGVYERLWCGDEACKVVLLHQLYVERAERKLKEAQQGLQEAYHLLNTAIRMFNEAKGEGKGSREEDSNTVCA